MNESICLHIQDCELGPIRVVELQWNSVRIGMHTVKCDYSIKTFLTKSVAYSAEVGYGVFFHRKSESYHPCGSQVGRLVHIVV